MSALCPCGAEAVVVSGPTKLCVSHLHSLSPADLYRLERAESEQRRAPRVAEDLRKVRRVLAAIESPETRMGLKRRRRTQIAVGRNLHG